jgi:hypothetical protein
MADKREYDKELYKGRNEIKRFSAGLKRSGLFLPVTTNLTLFFRLLFSLPLLLFFYVV